MIPEKLLRELDEEARRAGVRTAVLLTRDVIDYFADIARVTDRVEMGGFVLGKVRTNYAAVFVFYDYVQARNVSDYPELSFVPDEESVEEVLALLRAGRYDAVAMMHTHPDEGGPSPEDLGLNRIFGDVLWLDVLRRTVPLPREKVAVPGFLVIDGDLPPILPAVVAYAYKAPFVLAAAVGERIVSRTSVALPDLKSGKYCEKLVEFTTLKASVGKLKNVDFYVDTIRNCQMAALPLKRIEELLSPEAV